MRFNAGLIALVVVVLCFGGCSVLGGDDADVNLHKGMATGIQVGENLYAPEETLRGCQRFYELTDNNFICRSGAHAGLVIYMDGDAHSSKVASIMITSDFKGVVKEGVGIGSSLEEVRGSLGQVGCGWGSSSFYIFGKYSARFDFDQNERVRSITLLKGASNCLASVG